MLDGEVEHGDSMGNKGTIQAGDIQWMTAGSGIIHQEMPKGNSKGMMQGFQLWANLPAKHKMIQPRYQEIKSHQVPVIKYENGVEIKVICGKVHDTEGPVQDIMIQPQYLDITVPQNTEYYHPVKKGHKAFAYVIGGEGYFCLEMDAFDYTVTGNNYFDLDQKPSVENKTLVLFDQGDQVLIKTENHTVRLLLISGKPIKEPVAWYGPIVMNSQQELKTAMEEYHNGSFIKHT
jgi:quercetin 2,3-dioxygenase